jgi:hypothetical protein
MIKRGRPFGSKIRQNIVEVLFFLGKGYGYEIHKVYCQLFDKCTREVVYYNLRKGVNMGEFKVEQIKIEKGDFSWGGEVRKIVYSLGEHAKPAGLTEIKAAVEKFKEERKE